MKKLLFSFTIFLVLLLVGCQENSITDPIQNVGQQEVQKNDNSLFNQRTMILEGMLTDPHPVRNSYYIIGGEIEYQHKLEFLDPIQPNSQFSVSLNLLISANFTYLCTVCGPEYGDSSSGSISIETNDIVYMSGKSSYLLEKSFPIQGRKDGMTLVCRFIVKTDGVSLNAKWLVLPETGVIEDVN